MPLLTKDLVPNILRLGGSFQVDEDIPPRFAPGDRVRARDINPTGHTRLPRYARGRQGVIQRDYGVFIFPDTNARGEGKKPQHLYNVRFMSRELWGPGAGVRDSVYLDMWDDYLDPAWALTAGVKNEIRRWTT